MAFSKTVDELLDAILADYQSQLPDVDRSVGSLTYIKSAVLAAALWGIYHRGDYVLRQIFPSSAETEFLEKWASVYNISRLTGETDSALLQRLLERIQQPPAGGNKNDFVRWAKEVSYDHTSPTAYTETVKNAWCYQNPRGVGTINVVITSDRSESGYEEIATSSLVSEVHDYIDNLRPVTAFDHSVISASRSTQNVTMAVTGVDSGVKNTIANEITAYMKTLSVGKTLFTSQLVRIAVDNGAEVVTLTTPSSDVTVDEGPSTYERIWPGTITVN